MSIFDKLKKKNNKIIPYENWKADKNTESATEETKENVEAINLISNESKIITIYEKHDDNDNIILSTRIDNKEYSSCSDKYLESFKELKDKLLSLGYGLQCVGAKINVNQSGMASSSDKVYLVELGKPATGLLSLYEYSNNKEYPTSEEQNDFINKWHNSLENRK